MKKKILILATTPFLHDGLTKIEMDVYERYKTDADFEFASSFGFDNDICRKIKEEQVPIHILKKKSTVIPYMKSIYQLVKSKGYDAVYINGNSAMMILEALPARLAGKGKIITHCHNTKSDYPIIHYAIKPVFNLLLDSKIGCSSLAAKWAFCGKNIEVIPNGIDVNRFRFNMDDRTLIRQELGYNDETVIGHIGRFSNQKNHQRIIDIFCEYKKHDANAKLVLIGEGENKAAVQKQTDNRGLSKDVKFIDYTSAPEKYLSAMDVMLMPSLFEGLCLVALEAQANGLPLVISDNISPETVVTGYVNQLSLKQADETWARAIEHYANLKGHQVVTMDALTTLNWDSMMERLGEIILG